MTKDVGLNGNLFGGNMLAWADEASAVYAREQCKYALMVTRKISEIEFTKPVKVGTILKFYGANPKFGKTHIEFTLIVKDNSNNVYFRTEFVFVAVDSDGNKTTIPVTEHEPNYFATPDSYRE